MVEEIRKGDISTKFLVTVKDGDTAEDISSATTKDFIFLKPDNSIVTKTATFETDGTDGKLNYTTVSDDLDLVGVWKLQASIVISAGTFKTSITTFRVYPNLN